MGPRSFERGKAAERLLPQDIRQLQWGRVRLNAERVDETKRLEIEQELQWGRVRLNAESSAR